MSFRSLASLLLPADPNRTGAIIETDDRWRVPPTQDAANDVVLWGRGPLPSGTRLPKAARSAFARERALRSLRRHGVGFSRLAGVHRLAPSVLMGGAARNRVRAALLGGAIVELWGAGEVWRVLDEVAEAAHGVAPIGRFDAGSGGSILARMGGGAGGEFVLRAGRTGDPADPHNAADALAALESLGLSPIPRLLARGEVAGASWTTESVVPGRRPAGVSAAVALDVARLCSALPRSEEPAAAHRQDLQAIADRFARWSAALSHLMDEVDGVAQAVPSVARHGDLWAGNLLVRRRRLAGVVDWDAWNPSALPGTDLLHLVAMGEALRTQMGLGQAWLGQPWTEENYRAITSEYWTSLRIAPNPRFLNAVGVAWWAGQVAASLRRLPFLAQDDRWVASNVDRVLEAVGSTG